MEQVIERLESALQEQAIPVQQLQPNEWNRKTFDAEGLQELSDSLKTKGILEPLIVRKLANGNYEIASGERRWRAAQLAGMKDVPCRVQSLTDEDVQDMNLVSNIQREDIPALDKAKMVKARMGSSLTQAQIAAKLGKSQQWVGSLLGFLDLPKEVHDNIAGTTLGVTHLQALKSLPTPEYQTQLSQEIKDGKVAPEAIQKRVHHLCNGFKASQTKKKKKDDSLSPAETPGTNSSPDAKAEAPASPVATEPVPAQAAEKPVVKATRPEAKKSNPPTAPNPATPGQSSTTRQLLTALKDELADKYLATFGYVGGVLRAGLDKAWAGSKKSLVKWALIFAAVSYLWHPVLKVFHYAFNRLMHVEVNRVMPDLSPVAVAKAAVIQTPQITSATYGTGHKVILKWNPVGPGYSYKVYLTSDYQRPHWVEVGEGKTVKTPGAVVNWYNQDEDPYLAIMAISADGLESELSEPVKVHLTVSNDQNSIEPLPI